MSTKLFENHATPRPFLRFHLPMLLVEARLIARKTPIPLEPELVGEKGAMLEQLREVRARTLVFMAQREGKT